jgi:short-subunit dehydrogenase
LCSRDATKLKQAAESIRMQHGTEVLAEPLDL